MTERFALPQIGDLLADKYRVLRVVADGGMGVVFEAHHELLGKNVALKFPLPELVHLPNVVERFLAEARLCARIENEHVVRVTDVSKLDGLPYIVMELVSGVSLARDMGTPWPPAKAAAFAVQLLEGLEAVHALGVVHRDVKPENVLVVAAARGPLLKLIDFGIAKDSIAEQAIGRLTRAGVLLGTPAYMAPEQIRDPLHAGSSVDLYSVGILLFEMLAGASPFTATNVYEIAQQALTGQLRSLSEIAPTTPSELVAIVARATALNAADRFTTASDFSEALAQFAQGWGLRESSARFSRPGIQPQVALRTEYAEPPTLCAVALRTEYAEPSISGIAASELGPELRLCSGAHARAAAPSLGESSTRCSPAWRRERSHCSGSRRWRLRYARTERRNKARLRRRLRCSRRRRRSRPSTRKAPTPPSLTPRRKSRRRASNRGAPRRPHAARRAPSAARRAPERRSSRWRALPLMQHRRRVEQRDGRRANRAGRRRAEREHRQQQRVRARNRMCAQARAATAISAARWRRPSRAHPRRAARTFKRRATRSPPPPRLAKTAILARQRVSAVDDSHAATRMLSDGPRWRSARAVQRAVADLVFERGRTSGRAIQASHVARPSHS